MDVRAGARQLPRIEIQGEWTETDVMPVSP